MASSEDGAKMKRRPTKKGIMRRVFSFKRNTSTTQFPTPGDRPGEDIHAIAAIEQGFATDLGFHHVENEDTSFRIDNLFDEVPPNEDGIEYHGTSTRKISTFGVFDGHGGTACSAWAAKQLPQSLSNLLYRGNFDDLVGSALHHGFKAVENSFCAYAKTNNDMSGSCATCVIIKGGKVFCGNAGDSKALLFQTKSPTSKEVVNQVALNDRHSSDLKSERNRIKAAGGRIAPDGSIYGVLFPSRGFGDIDVKSDGKPVVIPTPDGVGIGDRPPVELHPGQTTYIVIASDGLWDFAEDERVMSLTLKNHSNLDAAADKLVREARLGGSEDDITVIVLRVSINNGSLESVPE